MRIMMKYLKEMSKKVPTGKKWVQVGEKTWLEVDESIPDEVVKDRYLHKQNNVTESKARNPKGAGRPKKGSKLDTPEETE